jgi:hypothetical protein
MAATVRAMQQEGRCELCGARADTARERIAHLRAEHPAYARGLLLRLFAPAILFLGVIILAALKAPSWAYVVVLALSFGALFFGKIRSRVERSRAGARPTIGFKRLVREGGLPFLLLIPAVVLIITLLSRG